MDRVEKVYCKANLKGFLSSMMGNFVERDDSLRRGEGKEELNEQIWGFTLPG